jgi:homogentisate 1,2-dioxygenase
MGRAIQYLSGFHNEHTSEAVAGAVPVGRNSPQKHAFGLYPEQLSGTAFTMARKENYRSWLYRLLPSVKHGAFSHRPDINTRWLSKVDGIAIPDQLRWGPMDESKSVVAAADFISGFVTYAVNGDCESRQGSAVHLYAATKNMTDRYFYNSDGDLLIVPQSGRLHVSTEFGILDVEPLEVVMIPRGVKFRVELPDGAAKGYVCENFGAPWELPNLGPIGANGLAAPRDFLYPTAHCEDKKGSFELVTKFCGQFFSSKLDHSPLNALGWFGNYAPYKYDLRKYNTINTVSFDHPDPSIFTVLTSPTSIAGQANVDFVIFPPRWMVAEDTFRPPYYHRNIMSEFMGLIDGVYDAKPEGFKPFGASLHNCMQSHGPDADAFYGATQAQLKPHYLGKTMAFMFESSLVYKPTEQALKFPWREISYQQCWQDLKQMYPVQK